MGNCFEHMQTTINETCYNYQIISAMAQILVNFNQKATYAIEINHSTQQFNQLFLKANDAKTLFE